MSLLQGFEQRRIDGLVIASSSETDADLLAVMRAVNFPIVLMGKEYWAPLMEMIYRMVDEGMISPEDPDLIFFTDDVEEAASHIQRHAVRQFALRKKLTPQSIRVLGERNHDHLAFQE